MVAATVVDDLSATVVRGIVTIVGMVAGPVEFFRALVGAFLTLTLVEAWHLDLVGQVHGIALRSVSFFSHFVALCLSDENPLVVGVVGTFLVNVYAHVG